MNTEQKPQFVFAGSITRMSAPPKGEDIIFYAATDNGPLVDAVGNDELDTRHQIHQAAASLVEKCHREGVIEDLLASGFQSLVLSTESDALDETLDQPNRFLVRIPDPR